MLCLISFVLWLSGRVCQVCRKSGIVNVDYKRHGMISSWSPLKKLAESRRIRAIQRLWNCCPYNPNGIAWNSLVLEMEEWNEWIDISSCNVERLVTGFLPFSAIPLFLSFLHLTFLKLNARSALSSINRKKKKQRPMKRFPFFLAENDAMW